MSDAPALQSTRRRLNERPSLRPAEGEPRTEFRILGPLEVADESGRIALAGKKQRALLALLLLHANEVVSRDRLIDELWGEEPPATAANALQVHVHALRKLLGRDRLETRGTGYVLHVEPGELDLHRFEQFVDEAESALAQNPAAAADTLRRALELWRGPALGDFAYEELAQAEIARLEELRLAAQESLIEASLASGRHADVVAELEDLTRSHPLRERLHGQRMLALYRSGRQAEALAAYREARRVLVGELGLEPGPELADLHAAILRQDPALRAGTSPRPQLPAFATPMIGRRKELDELRALLSRGARLVTLTGPGGIGKTRLAVHLAAEEADRFPGEVYFVGLASVRDPDLVTVEMADAVGVEDPGGDVADALARQLGDRAVLIVVDNFEHVDDAAPDLGALLRRAAGLRLVVTSRHALRLYGEHEYAVPPLDLGAEAVPLFLERARARGRSFDAGAATADVCRHLDCLPLAIELAAGRAHEFSPVEMLERLPRRLELASAGPRDVPARQQTLRTTIDWSYRLLEADEQRLFARLAVFAGGFALPAAESVCDADLDTLASLVDNSLVVADANGAERRFRMLETIREYGLERLEESGEREPTRRRHGLHYLALAEEGEQALLAGGEQGAWLERLEREHDNLRAALAWFGRAREGELELRLATALMPFWRVRGHLSEGRRWLEDALARSGDAPAPLRAKALETAATFPFRQGDYQRARTLTEESLALYRKLGDSVNVARMLHELGSVALAESDYERAMPLYEESVEVVRAAGDTRRYAIGLSNLGALLHEQGNLEQAASLQDEALRLQDEIGDKDGAAITLHNLARTELRRGHGERGGELLARSLLLGRALGYMEIIAYCLEGFGEVAAAQGDGKRGARLLGAAEALFQRLGIPLQGSDRDGYEATVEMLRSRLGEHAFATAAEEGRALELERAIEEALRLTHAPTGVSGRKTERYGVVERADL